MKNTSRHSVTTDTTNIYTQFRASIQDYAKSFKIAALAITLFLGVVFAFALKVDQSDQKVLATALAPVQEHQVQAPLIEAQPTTAEPDIVGAEPTSEAGEAIGSGEASYYGPGFAGRPTASGETFDPAGLTAAHRTLPFGTRVRVTNTSNGKSVVVRINDRGPYAHGRLIDLSMGAAQQIGMVGSGTAQVELERLS